MGQYHHLVSLDAKQHLHSHRLGAGLKAWEQLCSSITSALPFLLSPQPGNEPGDVPWHPMVGAWAGQRLIVVGDYAENEDAVPGYAGPPLRELYGYCMELPTIENCRRWQSDEQKAKAYFDEKMAEYKAAEAAGTLFTDISRQIEGAIEFGRSMRFVGDRGWRTTVPVEPFAVKGADGKAHYVFPSSIKEHRDYYCRMFGLPEAAEPHLQKPIPPKSLKLERWPWDRAPNDLSQHNGDAREAETGQYRVWLNLDTREYIDPIEFGEVPTTLGLMRANTVLKPRMAVDMVISGGGIESNVKEGTGDYCTTDAVFAMLLHPESRGGGDIDPEDFPEIGRWRNGRLVLTPARDTELFPSTDTVKAGGYTNISGQVMKALGVLASRD